MTTFVVLLRGINVGGSARLPMVDLRAELGTAGFAAVRTYVASGNVVLESDLDPEQLAAGVRSLLLERFGLDRPVLVRSAEQLEQVVARNPFANRTEDPTKLHVVFTAGLEGSSVDTLGADAFGPEEFVVAGDEVYLYLPDGMARSELAAGFERTARPAVTTTRNWRTVLKLVELCGKGR